METEYLICVQCEAVFEFSVDEQMLYNARGFDKPLRCPACRKNKAKNTDSGGDRRRRPARKRDHRSRYDL